MILENFAKERKYNIDLLLKYGWYEENEEIKIKHSDEYIVTRTKDGQKIKPKSIKSIPYFLPGKSDKLVIVEGQTDAIAIKHIKEDLNVFSIGGTSSYNILKDINYYYQGKKIILAFDNDKAGKKCTEKVVELFINDKRYKNYDIRILSWNENIKDIDEYYRQFGVNEKLLKLNLFESPGKKITYEGEFIEQLQKLTNEPIIIGKKIKCVNPEHDDTRASMHIYKDHAYCYVCGYHIRPKRIGSKTFSKNFEENFSNALGYFTNYIEMAGKFVEKQPVFFDKSKMWWAWDKNKFCYIYVDEIDILNLVTRYLPDNMKGRLDTKFDILESLKRVGRLNIADNAPIKFIQFKDKAVNIENKTLHEVTPDYFFTNPIPWSIGKTDETPNMDRIFEEWVGENHVKTLYEIIAYCCLSDYPIQRMFFLLGKGSNGKSKYLNIIEKFLGNDNICSTELEDLLQFRFEKSRLYKKLVCLMGETNHKQLDKTSILKKLTGGELIGFEFKNKDPFEAKNYAKILIATNSLPQTTDKTDGFFRRCMIIDFPNQFSEKKDILAEIPEIEYHNLAKKIIDILPKLLNARSFTNEGTLNDRIIKYEEKSNPLKLFIKNSCVEDINKEIPFYEFYDNFKSFLEQNGFRVQSKVEVGKNLRTEGFEMEKKSVNGKTWQYIYGLEITQITQITNFTTNSLVKNLNENTVIPVIPVISVIQSLKKIYDNFIPLYILQEECHKKGIINDYEEIEKLKKEGLIAEYRVGHISEVT